MRFTTRDFYFLVQGVLESCSDTEFEDSAGLAAIKNLFAKVDKDKREICTYTLSLETKVLTRRTKNG